MSKSEYAQIDLNTAVTINNTFQSKLKKKVFCLYLFFFFFKIYSNKVITFFPAAQKQLEKSIKYIFNYRS